MDNQEMTRPHPGPGATEETGIERINARMRLRIFSLSDGETYPSCGVGDMIGVSKLVAGLTDHDIGTFEKLKQTHDEGMQSLEHGMFAAGAVVGGIRASKAIKSLDSFGGGGIEAFRSFGEEMSQTPWIASGRGAVLSGNVAREQILVSLEKVMQKYMPRIKEIAPDARVGIRGSLASGLRKAHFNESCGIGPFDPPANFDVDLFVESQSLRRPFKAFRGTEELQEIAQAIGQDLRQIPGFQGLREDPYFRILRSAELPAPDVQVSFGSGSP